MLFWFHLNTTIVKVQQLTKSEEELAKWTFKYNYCQGSTIIDVPAEVIYEGFKYNYCQGSTAHKQNTMQLQQKDLNTTIVKVQPSGFSSSKFSRTFKYNYCQGSTLCYPVKKQEVL